ncbi:MAG TPA: NERD domain-containing protein [Bacillales bacterium]
MPPIIRKLTALARRLPPGHPKQQFIENDLGRYRSGYHGEQSLDYQLSFLPKKTFHILHSLRLADSDNRFFQMDTILLTPFYILIIEAKNISGTVYFDEQFHQLIRTNDGQEVAFKDPLLQVEHQKNQFEHWLQAHKMPPLPIETIVVFTNSSTVIKTAPGNPKRYENVIHSMDLLAQVERFTHENKEEKLSEKELRKLSRTLIRKNTPDDPNVLARYSVAEADLLKGVHCPECGKLAMKRAHGIWVCPSCEASSKSAHVEALRDYALLIRPEITNQQLRDFLRLSSRTMATNILASMNLEHSGGTRGRRYWLFFDE